MGLAETAEQAQALEYQALRRSMSGVWRSRGPACQARVTRKHATGIAPVCLLLCKAT